MASFNGVSADVLLDYMGDSYSVGGSSTTLTATTAQSSGTVTRDANGLIRSSSNVSSLTGTALSNVLAGGLFVIEAQVSSTGSIDFFDIGTNADNRFNCYTESGPWMTWNVVAGSADNFQVTPGNVATATNYRAAIWFDKVNGYKVCINGGTVFSGTKNGANGGTGVSLLSDNTGGGYNGNGRVRTVMHFPVTSAVSDADLQAISTVGATTVGSSGTTASGAGSSSGAATVSGVGASQFKAAGTASGTGAASGVGAARKAASGLASGAGTASGVGAARKAAAGSASGLGSASAVGASRAASAGSVGGSAAVSGGGASRAAATGSATGSSTVSGAGASQAAGQATGTAAGSSTAIGIGASLVAAIGTAAGTSSAQAVSPSVAQPEQVQIIDGRKRDRARKTFEDRQDADKAALRAIVERAFAQEEAQEPEEPEAAPEREPDADDTVAARAALAARIQAEADLEGVKASLAAIGRLIREFEQAEARRRDDDEALLLLLVA